MSNDSNQLKLLEYISKFDVVSFDIFDTLITRTFKRPADLFFLMENIFSYCDSAWNGFAVRRMRAETISRLKCARNGCEDTSLDQIYLELSEHFDPKFDIHYAKQAELRLEDFFSLPIPKNIRLLDWAKRKSKRIILASDMYLPAAFVEHLLGKHKIRNFDELYLSSDRLKLKATGSLFREMQRLEKRAIVHLGDNIVVDYWKARRLGLASLYIRKPAKAVQSIGLTKKPNSIWSMFIEHTWWRQRGITVGDNDPFRYWYEVGYKLAGPMAFGFCRNIRRFAGRNGCEQIYFLARDGKLIQSVYDRLFKGPGHDTRYVFASRRMLKFPAIDTMDKDAVEFLTFGGRHATVRSIFERIDFPMDSPEFKKTLSTLFSGPDASVEGHREHRRLKQLIIALREPLLEHAKAERANVLGYLDHLQIGKCRSLIVDIGWRGSLQTAIETLTKKYTEGDEALIFGAYLGLYPAFQNKSLERRSSYLLGRWDYILASTLQHPIGLVEQLFSSPEPGIATVEKVGENYEARRIPPSLSERIAWRMAEATHRGVADFCEDVAHLDLVDRLPDPRDFIRSKLYQLYLFPSRRELLNLGAIQFSGGFGDSSFYDMVWCPQQTFNPYECFRCLRKSFWRYGFLRSETLSILSGGKFFQDMKRLKMDQLNAVADEPLAAAQLQSGAKRK